MQSENPANGAVFSDCTNSKFQMCQMLLFQHPGATQETLPVGLPLTPTQSLDTDVTSRGFDPQGGAACLGAAIHLMTGTNVRRFTQCA